MQLTPETAAQVAERSVAFVVQKFGFGLPYTPESLILVDAVVDRIRETGATEQQASGLLSGLGCYAGEVFVRNAHASWRPAAAMRMARSPRAPIVVAFPGARACDPIGRVFSRFNREPADGVAALYESAVVRGQAVPVPDAGGAEDA